MTKQLAVVSQQLVSRFLLAIEFLTKNIKAVVPQPPYFLSLN
jgi:hypothetical protein